AGNHQVCGSCERPSSPPMLSCLCSICAYACDMKPLPFLNPSAGTPAVRNPSLPAVIVQTKAVDSDELAADRAATQATSVADVIEWRVDPLLARSLDDGGASVTGNSPAEAVLDLLPAATGAGLPVLVTVRTAFEGGLVDIV